MLKTLLWLLRAKKYEHLSSSCDAGNNDECSLPTLAATHAHPGAQETKVAVLTLLTSGAKHVWFEASTSMLKVLCELLEHWSNVGAIVQAMRMGTRTHDPITRELKKSPRKHRKSIDELPKMEHEAHLPTLVQTNPNTWTKNSTCALTSVRTSVQACSLEFTAIQEDHAVSTTSNFVSF